MELIFDDSISQSVRESCRMQSASIQRYRIPRVLVMMIACLKVLGRSFQCIASILWDRLEVVELRNGILPQV